MGSRWSPKLLTARKTKLGMLFIGITLIVVFTWQITRYCKVPDIESIVLPIRPQDEERLSETQGWRIDRDELVKKRPEIRRWALVLKVNRDEEQLIARVTYDTNIKDRQLLIQIIPMPFGETISDADTVLLKVYDGGAIIRQYAPNVFRRKSIRFQSFIHESGCLVLGSDWEAYEHTDLSAIAPSLQLRPDS